MLADKAYFGVKISAIRLSNGYDYNVNRSEVKSEASYTQFFTYLRCFSEYILYNRLLAELPAILDSFSTILQVIM